ncbi:hypothetical protein BKA93DRAFT_784520 [Sparassis latifolia]
MAFAEQSAPVDACQLVKCSQCGKTTWRVSLTLAEVSPTDADLSLRTYRAAACTLTRYVESHSPLHASLSSLPLQIMKDVKEGDKCKCPPRSWFQSLLGV